MKKIFLPLIFAVGSMVFSLSASAEIIFEGYYKVSQFKKHIGFFVLRNELDSKTGNFKTISFTRLSKNGFDMTESLSTLSSAELAPISYSYLATDGKKTKTIDAKFAKDKMSAVATEDGKVSKVEKKIPKGTFLSTTLYYLMLKSKEGLKTDSKYDFQAIAEELADIKTGSAKVDKKMVSQGSMQLLKVTNKFAGIEYENLISDRGEAISASTAATGIETELVKSSEEALEGVKVSSSTLEKLFGDIPTGKVNIYHAKGK
ncbi:MAG: hypothetical protein A2622_05695 [Bdellovibrionales bacterium RIFCSPHIGHO2_01_FULL_40_29]|nr:MAG: hypothetical protein A2622_05695 [Bdellovibrionales bacterium RIFCSPHIGHO2_01_FULL_40_29]OFZ33111.1 MAG: hypothetical protein A3D17_13175 [Bdellovibrionales bacterium RIFCSPHIGHO2_02_FULL_40_15]